MKRSLILASLLIALLYFSVSCSKQDSSAEEATQAIPVEVMNIKLGNVVQSLNYNGDIKAEVEVRVFSKIPDRIEKFYVDEGDFVVKDAPIAKIYATTIQQGLAQAKAGLTAVKAQAANMKVEYERAQRLFQESAMSKQQYDAVKTQYEALEAQVQQMEAGVISAESQSSDAIIKAPVSGIIGKRYFEEGDMAAPSMPVVTIVQMEKVKISFDATETDLGKLAKGQKAIVSVKSFGDMTFEGKVSKISPILDPLTRMAQVEVLVDNPDKKLKPGMYAQVEVITGTIENTVVVPRYATIESTVMERRQGKDEVVKNYYIFVVENDKAVQRKLDVFYVNHVNIAVNGGVAVGEKMVISGQNNLRDSSKVSVVQKGGDES